MVQEAPTVRPVVYGLCTGGCIGVVIQAASGNTNGAIIQLAAWFGVFLLYGYWAGKL